MTCDKTRSAAAGRTPTPGRELSRPRWTLGRAATRKPPPSLGIAPVAPSAGRVCPHEVDGLTAAMREAAGRTAGGAVLEVELDLDDLDAGPHARRWSCRRSMPNPGANGRTAASASSRSARCPLIVARSVRPVSRRRTQRAKPTAAPRPPPIGRRSAATASSPSPRPTACTSGGRRSALAPRSASHSSTTADVSPGRRRASTAAAARVAAWPLPRRPAATTSAPCSRAIAAVRSREPSSATTSGVPGKARPSA